MDYIIPLMIFTREFYVKTWSIINVAFLFPSNGYKSDFFFYQIIKNWLSFMIGV
jgi:hypothetical protein